MASKPELDSELESFRRQWLADLKSGKRVADDAITGGFPATSNRYSGNPSTVSSVPTPQTEHGPTKSSSRAASFSKPYTNAPPHPVSSRKPYVVEDGSDYHQGYSFDEPAPASGHVLGDSGHAIKPPEKKELVSALDHFEAAMQKEGQGNMGESLKLYRRAYRLDNRVDRSYREKHFPANASANTSSATAAAQPSSSTLTKSKEQASTSANPEPSQPLSIPDLLTSFSHLRIEASPPDVEGSTPPPCPIAYLPDELLVHIMLDVAIDDIAAFARLSLVCKHLAYLVATEQRIWRRICIGPEFGFAGMRYRWTSPIEWGPSPMTSLETDVFEDEHDATAEHINDEDGTVITAKETARQRRIDEHLTTLAFTPAVYPSWRHMFRHRPRIRFSGCYISTVNYVRTGQASTDQATWGGAPIHIVTYYRYLRFFRDGSLISLLTTNEPADVVHHLKRDLLMLHRDASQSHLPSAVMHLAHRGRWHLSPPGIGPKQAPTRQANELGIASGDSDLYIETEGVGSKYIYRMDLSLRSAGKSDATRNTKLIWRSFQSYNKLTDDWGEFGLKNDKPFFFSRVRSYGLGE